MTDRLGYHDRNPLVSDWDGTRGLHSRQVWTAAMLHHCRSCLLHPRFSPSHTECAYTVVPRIPDASAHRCHRQYNVEHFPWTTSTRVISTRIPRWAPPLSLIKHTVPVVRESRPLDRANEQRTNILARSRSYYAAAPPPATFFPAPAMSGAIGGAEVHGFRGAAAQLPRSRVLGRPIRVAPPAAARPGGASAGSIRAVSAVSLRRLVSSLRLGRFLGLGRSGRRHF